MNIGGESSARELAKAGSSKCEFGWQSSQQLSQRHSDSCSATDQNSIYSNLNAFDACVGTTDFDGSNHPQFANKEIGLHPGSSKLVSIPLLSDRVDISATDLLEDFSGDHIPRCYESRVPKKRQGLGRPNLKLTGNSKGMVSGGKSSTESSDKGEMNLLGIQKFKLSLDKCAQNSLPGQ